MIFLNKCNLRLLCNMTEELYIVLKDGEPTKMRGSLSVLVEVVRTLESNINRQIEHSPYTIIKVDQIPQIANTK